MAADNLRPNGKQGTRLDRSDANLDETRSADETGGDEVCTSSVQARDWLGKRLGKYKVIEVIGAGGMGFVLKAYDPTIERDVAIKMLHPVTNPIALERFQTEARAAGKLSHANVASIYEIGQEGSANFLVMELLSGGSVEDELQVRGAYFPLEATLIMIDACRGIAAAHSAGLVHRDIKPANLVKTAEGSVKITDFGLAKLSRPETESELKLTQPGSVIGTPYFMSPEQWQGETVDARSDIYALGATYYCLLTGRQPFEDSDGIMQVMQAHCRQAIPDPRVINANIPSACSAIVSRAMAKSPAERYQSAAAMLNDLLAVSATLSGEVQINLPSQVKGDQPTSVVENTISRRTVLWRRLFVGGFVMLLLLGIASVTALFFWGNTPPGSQAAVAPQGEPIRVGILHSLSGTMSRSGASVVDATLLAIEEINQSGGLLGRPIEAIVSDGRSNTDIYASEAERLIMEESVCAVFGCWTSASRKTVKPIVEEKDHLLIYPVQFEGLETSPNIMYLGAAPNQQIIPAVQWAHQALDKQRFFLVGSDYVFPRAAGEIIKDQVQEMDADVVGEVYLPLGSRAFEPVIDAILQSKPDMILNTVNGDSNVSLFRALRKAGISSRDIPCLSFSIGEQELLSLDIASLEGDYAATAYFQSVDTSANYAFVERFHAKYPHHVVTSAMANSYVGVQLWAQAVREAESIEPRKVRRAMLNQRIVAPEGEVRIDPETQYCFKTPRVGQIQNNGQFKIVWSAEKPIRPEPYPDSRTAEDWKAFLHDLYLSWGSRWISRMAD